MAFHSCCLPNGLRIIHIPSASDVTYCGYVVDAGTRDEYPEEQGMAHFVEHNIFKGTTRRRPWHILNRMEHVGGNLDAFTAKEETVIYSVFLNEHFNRAAELLTDIVFHSTFPQHEIAKEVEVIIDEIQSYEDTPAELIFDDFEELLFKGHPLGRNILGKPEQLRLFTTDCALKFVRRYYRPDNAIFFVQGKYRFEKIIRAIEKLTADLSMETQKYSRVPVPAYEPQQVVNHRDTHQAHVVIGCRGFEAKNKHQSALFVLNNILGGPGMNSRLNLSLREKRGLVYNVEANVTSYTDTGVFTIYFGCDPKDVDACIELTYKELKKLREQELTSSQLAAVKKQIIGQLGVAGDNFENNALEAGKIFLHYNRYDEPEEIYRRIQDITSKELLEVANEKFDERVLSTLIYA